MADNLCKSEAPNVLLVEGLNDCHVVMALCNYYNLSESFGIHECGGDQQLMKRLNALISAPTPPEKIGVLLDADAPDLHGRWMSLRQKLNRYHYEFPDEPPIDGAILSSLKEKPRLGVWLMPNNQETGMLEDFCAEMIEEEARAVAERCVQIAQQEGVWAAKQMHYTKSVVHTFLAWQDAPGCPLGQAITQHSLRGDSKIAISFVGWLSRLFIGETETVDE